MIYSPVSLASVHACPLYYGPHVLADEILNRFGVSRLRMGVSVTHTQRLTKCHKQVVGAARHVTTIK
jgi:hypothetical protein